MFSVLKLHGDQVTLETVTRQADESGKSTRYKRGQGKNVCSLHAGYGRAASRSRSQGGKRCPVGAAKGRSSSLPIGRVMTFVCLEIIVWSTSVPAECVVLPPNISYDRLGHS